MIERDAYYVEMVCSEGYEITIEASKYISNKMSLNLYVDIE